MGADAHVFVFDYQRYRTEVVAPLIDLFRTGTPGPRLTGYFRRPHRGRWPCYEADFATMAELREDSMRRTCREMNDGVPATECPGMS